MNAYEFFDKFAAQMIPLYEKGVVRINYDGSVFVIYPREGMAGLRAEELRYLEAKDYDNGFREPRSTADAYWVTENVFKRFVVFKVREPIREGFDKKYRLLIHLESIPRKA